MTSTNQTPLISDGREKERGRALTDAREEWEARVLSKHADCLFEMHARTAFRDGFYAGWRAAELRQCEALVQARTALEAVAFFWGRDPLAFGDDATVTSLAGKFARVADQCRKALATLDALNTNEEAS